MRKKEAQALALKVLKKKHPILAEAVAIQALPAGQCEKALLRQAASHLSRSSLRKLALMAGGAGAGLAILVSAGHYRFYQVIVARELKKQLGPIQKQLDEIQQRLDRMEGQKS